MKRIQKPSPATSKSAATPRSRRLRLLNEQLAEFVPACPWARRNPIECPLYDLRKQKVATMAKWIDGLSVAEKEYLVLYHECCLATKRERETARAR